MIRRIATVGGLTLVSRLSGFIRDVVMAAILGAGPLADAFFVAFRLPNHFRAIFAEGAFAAAFVPAYARTLEEAGLPAAKLFSDQIAAALVTINLVLLAIALLFTPEVVSVLAPGLIDDPERFDLAVALTRITFPYLSLESLFAGILNANNRFAAAASAPVLLNLSVIATLLLTPYFADAGHAAAWGVLIAGVAQAILLGADAEAHGFGIRLRMPKLDEPTRKFLKALGPAIVGAGGVQLALFADTLIATFLPTAALAAGSTLAAYSVGLLPFVLLRSFTAPFYARRDTLTPVKAALLAATVNIALKFVLMGPLAQVGLALATSIGAWINLSLLAYFARRQGFAVSGTAIGGPVAKLIGIGVVFAAALFAGAYGLQQALSGLEHFRDEIALAVLVVGGGLLYFVLVFAGLGRRWFTGLLKDVSAAADSTAPVNLEAPDLTDDSEALPDSEPPPKG